ncbi:immunity-specific protein Beta371 [Corynebacterium ulcerans]|nr:immunity-specific protein Beta371 [Corynebacterium ulcerans]
MVNLYWWQTVGNDVGRRQATYVYGSFDVRLPEGKNRQMLKSACKTGTFIALMNLRQGGSTSLLSGLMRR